MFEAVKGWALRILRVPPEPTAPEGGRIIRVFRASRAYYRYKLAFWAFGQLWALAALIFGLVVASAILSNVDNAWARGIVTGLEIFGILSFVAQAVFSYVMMRLNYELRWYILSDRSLRIREGVASVHEKTVTFANIQQISIHQNPFQRLVGVADVQVSTAGGGASGGAHGGQMGESMHDAYFRGVDNAVEIRDVIRERVRMHRDTGLGDPDDPAHVHALPAAAATESDVLAAARELLDEVRHLRRAAIAPRSPS